MRERLGNFGMHERKQKRASMGKRTERRSITDT